MLKSPFSPFSGGLWPEQLEELRRLDFEDLVQVVCAAVVYNDIGRYLTPILMSVSRTHANYAYGGMAV